MRYQTILVFLLMGMASLSARGDDSKAQEIVDRAIAVHGGERFEHSTIRFDFRGIEFEIWREGGEFRYERRFSRDGREVRDILTNEGFWREADGMKVDLGSRARASAHEAVNSVPYFALLPFRLNDPSVVKEYAGRTTIREEPYHRVEVRFADEEDVTDPDNEFLFWFHADTGELDYFAYSSGGNRFREAIESETVNGILFNQYANYRTDPSDLPLIEAEDLFERGELTEVSRIILENIEVELH